MVKHNKCRNHRVQLCVLRCEWDNLYSSWVVYLHNLTISHTLLPFMKLSGKSNNSVYMIWFHVKQLDFAYTTGIMRVTTSICLKNVRPKKHLDAISSPLGHSALFVISILSWLHCLSVVYQCPCLGLFEGIFLYTGNSPLAGLANQECWGK